MSITAEVRTGIVSVAVKLGHSEQMVNKTNVVHVVYYTYGTCGTYNIVYYVVQL